MWVCLVPWRRPILVVPCWHRFSQIGLVLCPIRIRRKRLFDIVPLTLLADGASYASIFIVVVVALSLTSHLLAEAAKSLGLGPLDRTLGVLFGLIRGVVLISVMYIPLHLLNDEKAKALLFENSHTHFYLEHIAEFTVQYLPEGAQGPDSSDGIDVEAVQDSARENLQTIDLLKKEGLSNDDVERLEGAARDAVEGYSEEFRENMQQLIEDADQAISEEIAPTQPTQTEGENAQ